MQMTFLHTQAHSFRSVHFAHSARRVIYASTSGDALNPSSILFVAKNFHLAQSLIHIGFVMMRMSLGSSFSSRRNDLFSWKLKVFGRHPGKAKGTVDFSLSAVTAVLKFSPPARGPLNEKH